MPHTPRSQTPSLQKGILLYGRIWINGNVYPFYIIVLLVVIGAAILGGAPTRGEPDLARELRLMAAMKGTFALAAFTACYWRLARPANPWRMAIYVAAPPLMAAGAAGMWSLHHLGVAALGLHAGLFAVLAAALTDPDFLPALRLKSGRRL